MRLFDWRSPKNSARPPQETILAAIGDIHGDIQSLKSLIQKISAFPFDFRPVQKTLIFMGDYIDRGPDSRAVLEYLINDDFLHDWEKKYLIGNHEQMFLDYFENGDAQMWLQWGKGQSTLSSYLPEAPLLKPDDPDCWAPLLQDFKAVLPESHIDFMRRLENMIVLGDYAFVHAGINPRFPLDQQSLKDLLWIRKPFLTWKKPFSKMIVHGHTPVKKPQIKRNRIAIDTGCARQGYLSCVILHHTNIDFLTSEPP